MGSSTALRRAHPTRTGVPPVLITDVPARNTAANDPSRLAWPKTLSLSELALKDELVMPLLGAVQWLEVWEQLQRASGCERFLDNPPSFSSRRPR